MEAAGFFAVTELCRVHSGCRPVSPGCALPLPGEYARAPESCGPGRGEMGLTPPWTPPSLPCHQPCPQAGGACGVCGPTLVLIYPQEGSSHEASTETS